MIVFRRDPLLERVSFAMCNYRKVSKALCGVTLLLSVLLLSACVTTTPVDLSKINMNDITLDVSHMGETLLAALTFDDSLVPMEEEIAAEVYGVAGLYNTIAVYGSTGATAEVLLILRCDSATDAEAAEARLATYRDEMAAVYADYNTVESEKLTDAVLECEGRYVLFCVSPDPDAVSEAYRAYVVDSLKK